MKTIEKAYSTAVHAENLEDIVFEGRNQTYGAYSLRRNYNSRLNLSTLAVISLTSLIVLIAYVRTMNQPPIVKPTEPAGQTVIIEIEDINKIIPPPSFSVEAPRSILDISRFTPNIVDEEVPEEKLITMDGLFSDFQDNNQEGLDLTTIKYLKTDDNNDGAIDNQDGIFFEGQVTEEAMFRGGTVDDFRKWLAENIVYPERALGGDIFGTVQLRFTIDKNGKVCDVQIDRGIHPLIDQAAIDAVMSSPKWRAARIDGNPVKVCYIIPIKFSIIN